mmetsp:Transcript_29077/g.32293  ORF Transcript_29077/g.32293 Transcript_29077/m.32293 type:complete len:140 (+) Transcript_29077:16-435(+)
MTIFNFYIYTKTGRCIFYKEWNFGNTAPDSRKEIQQLMWGLAKALNSFVKKTSPTYCEGFTSYVTSTYKLHFFESATGVKFIINTDPKVSSMQSQLHRIYRDFFVEYVVKNPLYKLNEPVDCVLFEDAIEEFVTSLPFF